MWIQVSSYYASLHGSDPQTNVIYLYCGRCRQCMPMVCQFLVGKKLWHVLLLSSPPLPEANVALVRQHFIRSLSTLYLITPSHNAIPFNTLPHYPVPQCHPLQHSTSLPRPTMPSLTTLYLITPSHNAIPYNTLPHYPVPQCHPLQHSTSLPRPTMPSLITLYLITPSHNAIPCNTLPHYPVPQCHSNLL